LRRKIILDYPSTVVLVSKSQWEIVSWKQEGWEM
jgi:hypothetical protein